MTSFEKQLKKSFDSARDKAIDNQQELEDAGISVTKLLADFEKQKQDLENELRKAISENDPGKASLTMGNAENYLRTKEAEISEKLGKKY